MTEEVTFKKLQGLTGEEAEAIHTRVYHELLCEYEAANPGAPKPWPGIPISELRARVDNELLPYGWSFYKLIGIEINRGYTEANRPHLSSR